MLKITTCYSCGVITSFSKKIGAINSICTDCSKELDLEFKYIHSDEYASHDAVDTSACCGCGVLHHIDDLAVIQEMDNLKVCFTCFTQHRGLQSKL